MYSFANAASTRIRRLQNYTNLLSSTTFQNTLFNTLLWIIIVPAGTIVLGLLVAVLADRLRPRGEKLAKTLIFLPLAIGGVERRHDLAVRLRGQPPGQNQIGLLNGIGRASAGTRCTGCRSRPCTSTACCSWSS